MVLIPVWVFAQNNEGEIMQIAEITVKPENAAKFNQGMKLYKDCYQKNKGTDHWKVWQPVQGNPFSYYISGTIANLAELDKNDSASKACAAVMTNYVFPYAESINNTLAKNMPQYTNTEMGDGKVISVTYFKVKKIDEFMEVLKGLTAAIIKVDGKNDRGAWFRIIHRSPDDPNYFVTDAYKDFADVEKPRPGPWKIYENVNGKQATDSLLAKWKDATEIPWSYLFRLRPDLSN